MCTFYCTNWGPQNTDLAFCLFIPAHVLMTSRQITCNFTREPMDWFADQDNKGQTTWFRPDDRWNVAGDGISVEEQEGDPDSLLSYYQEVLRLRMAHPALVEGDFEIVVRLIGSVGCRSDPHVRESTCRQRPWDLTEILVYQVFIMHQNRHSHAFNLTSARSVVEITYFD